VASVSGGQAGVTRGGPNRRKHRWTRAPVRCHPEGVESRTEHLDSIDVGFGGLRIVRDERHLVGALVQLEICSPLRAPASLTAEVIWIEQDRDGATLRFEMGLAFVELGSDATSSSPQGRRLTEGCRRASPAKATQG
jgi:hypothetical protein